MTLCSPVRSLTSMDLRGRGRHIHDAAIQIRIGNVLRNHFENFQNFSHLPGKVGIQVNNITLMSLIRTYFKRP